MGLVFFINYVSASITFVAPSPANNSVVTSNIQTLNVSITETIIDFYYLINDNTDGTQYLIPPTLTNLAISFYIGAGINNIQAVAQLSNGSFIRQNLTFIYGDPVFNSTFTDIVSCPYTILNSGNYRLANNLNSTVTCITILISNVNLDLNGKNIFYSNSTSRAIDVSAKSNVSIRNGSATANASSDFIYYNNNNNNNNNMTIDNLIFNGTGSGYLANAIEVNNLLATRIDGYNLIKVGLASTNINLTNIRSNGKISTSGNTAITNSSFGSLLLLAGNLNLTDILNTSATYSFSSGSHFFYKESSTNNNLTINPVSSSGILSNDLQFSNKGLVARGSFNTYLDAWINISNPNNLYLFARDGYVPINQYGDIDVFNLTTLQGFSNIVASQGGNLSIVNSPFCPNRTIDKNFAIDCSWHCTLKDNINVSNYGFYFYNNGSAVFQNVSILAKIFSNRYVNVGYDILQSQNESQISLSASQVWTQNFNFTWWQLDAPSTTGRKNIIFGGTDPTTPYTSLEERFYSPTNFSLVFHTTTGETFCDLSTSNTSGWHKYSFAVVGTTAYASIDGNPLTCVGSVGTTRHNFSLLFSPMYQCGGQFCMIQTFYSEALQNRVFDFSFYNSSAKQFQFKITKFKGVSQVDLVSNNLTLNGLTSNSYGINDLNKDPLDYAICQLNATAGTSIRGIL